MRLFAFTGTHYGKAAGADAGPLVAPPYDQIDDTLRDELHARSPHQFAHLIRPLAPGGGDIYRRSRDLHEEWKRQEVVTRDDRPAIYPYVIRLGDGRERLGVLGLIGFEEPSSGVIRPHEQTLEKAIADRLALLRATRVDYEPVLLVAEDDGTLDLLLAEDVTAGTPLVTHRDADGVLHVVYRVDDAERVARYRDVLAQSPAAIADGHHRYKVGQTYAREIGAEPPQAAAAKLGVVTSVRSQALKIDPIHRALREVPDLCKAVEALVGRRRVEATSGWDFAAQVAAAEQPAIGLWRSGEAQPEIWNLDPGRAPQGTRPETARLAVVLLQQVLYPAMGLGPDAATDGTLVYRSDPDKLHREVTRGELALGLFLPPMLPEEFAAAIAHGELLPPKSTRFLPKVMSGLVWAEHDAKLA